MGEAEGAEGSMLSFFWSLSSNTWMGHSLSEVLSEVIRLQLKK